MILSTDYLRENTILKLLISLFNEQRENDC